MLLFLCLKMGGERINGKQNTGYYRGNRWRYHETYRTGERISCCKFVTIPPAAAQMMTKASIPYFHID